MLASNAADVGNIVRERRVAAGLSQTELANRIRVSRKWIVDLERGHPRAQLQLVLDVLNALDALVDTPDAAPSADLPSSALEGLRAAIVQNFFDPGQMPDLTRWSTPTKAREGKRAREANRDE